MLQFPERVVFPPRVRTGVRTRTRPAAAGEPGEIVLCAGMHGQIPTILALADDHISFAWVPKGASRGRDIAIRDVVAVEETTHGRFAEVTILTREGTVTLTEALRVRAWEFCRRVREAILAR